MRHSTCSVFLSHCRDDVELMKNFSTLLNELYGKNYGKYFFNTFEEKNSTKAGDDLPEALRQKLSDATVLIAMITDNYMRSVICIEELSAFWFQGAGAQDGKKGSKKIVIPIIFNGATGENFLRKIFGEIIFINNSDVSDKIQVEHNAGNLINTLEKLKRVKFLKRKEDCIGCAAAFFGKARQEKSKRAFIDGEEEWNNILKYCEDFGITRISNNAKEIGDMKTRLANCSSIFIVSTTGANLIKTLTTEFLPKVLADGADITVILPNKGSDFIRDVAEIEKEPDDYDDVSVADNFQRLKGEFMYVIGYLRECVKKACKQLDVKKGSMGHVYIACAYTMLRQTITLGVRSDGSLVAFMTTTLPPQRSAGGTPQLEISGTCTDERLGQLLFSHVQAICSIAQKRGTYKEITADTPRFDGFYLEHDEAKKIWTEKYEKAIKNMSEHRNCSDELIEVAAQHPLIDGKPGGEFMARLDCAIDVYNNNRKNKIATRIYVPGSLHMCGGKEDLMSLSRAGINYLLGKGVPEEDILPEDVNEQYKGEAGVYNSADECFVAAEIFKANDFRALHCVCSPNQMQRKKLFYVSFGVLPIFHPTYCDNMFHNDIDEIFDLIPEILLNNDDWQNPESKQFQRTREERNPTYKKCRKLT